MIPFAERFNTIYELKEDMHVVLNDLYVYAVVGDNYQAKVGFDIVAHTNGDKYIKPRYTGYCDCYMLMGYRTTMCKTLTIEPEDYFDVMKRDGKFTFTMEDKLVKLTFRNAK